MTVGRRGGRGWAHGHELAAAGDDGGDGGATEAPAPPRADADAAEGGAALFREMANGLPLIVWMHDVEGRHEMVNDRFCAFFGVTRDELAADCWQDLLHPDDAGAFRAAFEAAVAAREPFHAEARVRRGDGEWRWLESWARPRFDPSGAFRGMVGTGVDVTERRSVERALAEATEHIASQHMALLESEQRLRFAVEATGLGTYDFDRATGRATWSERLGEIFGVPGAGPLDAAATVGARLHPDDRERFLEHARRVLEASGPDAHTIEYRIVREDGAVRWLWEVGQVVARGPEGAPLRIVGSVLDVTDNRAAEDALREADRRKDEYLATLGHELRNPIAALQSAIDLVQRVAAGDGRLERAVDVLARQSEQMARLVDGLLEVSRIARGSITLDRAPVDLTRLCRETLDDRRRLVERHGLTLAHHLPAEPTWAFVDRSRLVQVLDNLLGNAMKYTPAPGQITVTLAREGDRAVLRIRDTGRGIARDALEAIFEPFHQERPGRGGGLGLGLALSRGLVELHGGAVVAHSDGPGTGAELVVTLPALEAPAAEPAADPHPSADLARRILLVEDNDDAAEMLAAVLGALGHRVRTVGTVREALERLRSERFDVVLCDIGLPDATGYDLARAVRREPDLRDLTLLALTGYGQERDRREALEAGFAAHLVKPVKLGALAPWLAGSGDAARRP